MTTISPIVWTIAGSDSGGGAGIQADLKTFHDFSVHGCSVITALTAQNSNEVTHIQGTHPDNLHAQLLALTQDMPPTSIKLGMLYDADLITCIASHLQHIHASVVADPVLVSSNGDKLYTDKWISHYLQYILPLSTLITPNIHEASALTGLPIHSFDDIEKAAGLLRKLGARAVLVKGGDLDHNALSSDYFCDETQSFWINQQRINTIHTHGTGCTLSSAIAAAMAQGWSLYDAIVLAKAYVHAGITSAVAVGKGRHPIGHVGLQHLKKHFPWITPKPQPLPQPFQKITKPIGRYPVVDNLNDLETLCQKGISFIQLRIKDPEHASRSIFENALQITQSYCVTLVVNDHIHLAKSIHAPALHLGQEDVTTAPLHILSRDKIMLGISAHNLYELARAYAYHPSYLTMGPVFKTTSKELPYDLIGMEKLAFIASLSPLPLVAIGGISLSRTQAILNIPCAGAAFIKASKQLMLEGRYDRHMALPHFDAVQQQRLLQSKIACIGTGGLAAGFLPYLAAAGVGTLTLIDPDLVSYSNLQRQVLFREQDIGAPKVTVAARYLSELNTQITVFPHMAYLTAENALALLSHYDVIIDGTDNFESHYLINDTARKLNTPLIAAAVFQDKGHLFHLSPTSGCYRCAFPDAYGRPSCQMAGVLGTTPALLGVMQAALAIQVLSGASLPSFCRTVDMATGTVNTLMIQQDATCCHS